MRAPCCSSHTTGISSRRCPIACWSSRLTASTNMAAATRNTSRAPAARRRGCTAEPSCRSPRGALRLDLVPDQRRDVRAAEILDRADAGWRGDVDLGEIVADHVDADEQKPALA